MEKTTTQMTQWKMILLLFVIAMTAGCGTDDFNRELGNIHKGGPNCAQSSCHDGFTISGSIFELIDSETLVPGEILWVIPPDGSEWALRADALGNFWEAGGGHQGNFLFRVGTNGATSANHPMPDFEACNTCHAPLGSSDIAVGRIF